MRICKKYEDRFSNNIYVQWENDGLECRQYSLDWTEMNKL